MPIGTIDNGDSGSSARTKINAALTAVDGLGDAATKNVGAASGDIAAGDDPRFDTGAVIAAAEAITTIADTDQIGVSQGGTLKSIAYSALKTLLGALYQAKATILGTLGGLSNAAGYLKNDGAGVLSWDTPSGGSGGNWVLISTTTISGSPTAIDFTLSGAYRQYRLEFDNVYQGADGVTIRLRTSTDGGSTFDAGASDYNYARGNTTGYAPTSATSSAVEIHPGGSSDADEGITGYVDLFDPHAATKYVIMAWRLYNAFWNGGAMQLIEGSGRRNAAADVDAVRVITASSTFEGGKIRLFGWSE